MYIIQNAYLSPYVCLVCVFVCFRFGNMGVSMVLVGETLMRADDPGKAIRTLLGKEDATPVRGFCC